MVRLRIDIDDNVVRSYREKRYNWNDIALCLGVSRNKLLTWRIENNFEEPLNFIDNGNEEHLNNLDQVVIDAAQGNINVGERLTIGYVRTTNLNPTRQQIRSSLRRVDHEGIEHRSIKKIRRRR